MIKCLLKYVFLELEEIAVGLNSLEGEKVSRENMEDFLENLGITSFKDEVEKILQSDIVSGEHLHYSQGLSRCLFFFIFFFNRRTCKNGVHV